MFVPTFAAPANWYWCTVPEAGYNSHGNGVIILFTDLFISSGRYFTVGTTVTIDNKRTFCSQML